MRFSERYGHVPPALGLQVSDMDAPLRNSLWSVFSKALPRLMIDDHLCGNDRLYRIAQALWFDHLKLPLDSIPEYSNDTYDAIRTYFMKCPWYAAYDFVEFLLQDCSDLMLPDMSDRLNAVLERERAAYRVVAGVVTPIVEEIEIAAVADAVEAADGSALAGVRVHLETAVKLLSDRQQPDYRNSVKESISAVESLCRRLCGDEKASLGGALKSIGKSSAIDLHGSLQKGFEAIYGYASDKEGIRHALLNAQSPVGFAEAKYMAVACSAFVSFLILKAAEAGLDLSRT